VNAEPAVAAGTVAQAAWLSSWWFWVILGFLGLQLLLAFGLIVSWARKILREQSRTRRIDAARELIGSLLQDPGVAARRSSASREPPAKSPAPRRVLLLAEALAQVVEESMQGEPYRQSRELLAAALRPSLKSVLRPLIVETRSPWDRIRGALISRPRLERVLSLIGVLPDPELLPEILSLASSRHRRVACNALLVIGQGARYLPGATFPIAATIREETPPSRIAAHWALRHLLVGSPEMIPPLIQDPDPLIRAVAIGAAEAVLATPAPSDDAAQLSAALAASTRDPEDGVRLSACLALRRCHHPQRVALLGQALGDPAPGVRRAAAMALGEIGDPAAAEPLIARLDKADLELREDLLGALGMLREPPIGQWLAQARSGDPRQRRIAIMALGTRRDPALATTMMDLLDDPEVEVRRETARSLGAIARGAFPASVSPRVVDKLVDRLSLEESRSTLTAVARALAFAGDASTIARLLQHIADSPSFLREQLLESIAVIELTRAAA